MKKMHLLCALAVIVSILSGCAEAEPGAYQNFKGAIKGSRLEGQFTVANGNISGELSADGAQLTGAYNFTDWPFDNGTWNAKKK
jgi:hypothetical protein